MRTIALLGLVLGVSLLTSLARAQDAPLDPVQAEAFALFRRGVELGEEERWTEALELFRRSRELAERPNTVFNIGFALVRLGRFTAAVEAFDRYLAMTEGERGERREEAARLRDESAARIAAIELEVTPSNARVSVDGEPLAGVTESPHVLWLDPGRHTVRASAEGYAEGSLTVAVLAGERGARSLVLEPLPRAATPPAEERSFLDEPVLWIVTGIVVVGAGIAIGVAIAESERDELYGGSTGIVLHGLRF